MGKHTKQISEFSLEGRFLGFVLEDGYKIKYLRLATVTGEQCIKLSKEARASVGKVLTPGEWIRVVGEQKSERDTDVVKLKAYLVQPISARTAEIVTPNAATSTSQPVEPVVAKTKTTILVCQKSDCMKRGGTAVCAALEAGLRDRGLQEQVQIRGTGCMKQCKAGPNLIVSADKTRYSRITANEVPALLDKHFAGLSKPEAVAGQMLGPGARF